MASRSCCRPGIGEQGGELVDEPPGRGGGEDRVAAGDGADGGEQLGRRRVLQQEAAGAGLEPGEDVLVEVEGGEDEDLAGRAGGGDRGGRRDPVHARHPDVHQHDVGVQGRCHADPGRPVAGLADDLDVGLGLQDQPEPHPEQGLIIDEQYPDHAASPSSSGSRAETSQPAGLARAGLHVAAVGVDPFPHADQAAADAAPAPRGAAAARAVVVDVDAQLAGLEAAAARQARAPAPPCLRVLVRASCTSRYTVELHARRARPAPAPWISSVVSSPADRTCSMSASSWARSGTGCRASASSPATSLAAGALAQHAEEPAGIGQRRRPVADTLRMTSVARSGELADAAIAASAQRDHDREVVGDDVVHLAGDPGALGRRGERALLVSLAFQPLGPVVQLGEVGAAGGRSTGRARGRRRPGRRGRSRRYHQVLPARQEQRGDRGQLEHGRRRPARPRAAAARATVYRAMSRARPLAVVVIAHDGDPRALSGQHHAEHRDGPDPADQQRRGRQGQHDDRRHGARGGRPSLWYDSGNADAAAEQGDQHVEYPAARGAVRWVSGWPERPHARHCPPRSGVGASQPPGRRGDEDHGVPAQQREPGPRRQRVRAAPCAPPHRASPALEGRYWVRWSLIEAGSRPVSGGMTKNTPAKVAIPAAVLRNSAPRATPIMPGHGHVQGGADDRPQGAGGGDGHARGDGCSAAPGRGRRR